MRKRDELTDPNSCLNKAHPDEWLFVLIGRDEAFPGTARHWIGERIRLGLNQPGDAKLLDAEATAAAVEAEQAGGHKACRECHGSGEVVPGGSTRFDPWELRCNSCGGTGRVPR